MEQNTKYMISLVDKCREEDEIRQRISILEFINSLLPIETKLKIPSLITNTCIDNLLSALEAPLLPPIYGRL
ncbi:MAG TPA: hypothetical protein VIA09_02805 [Nitrososphaeraceae archaeon]|jgi:hypothetical protein